MHHIAKNVSKDDFQICSGSFSVEVVYHLSEVIDLLKDVRDFHLQLLRI